MAKILPIKPKSVLTKLSSLLDETLGLVKDARCYIRERRERERRQGVDLFGPNGTEMRFGELNYRSADAPIAQPTNIVQPGPSVGGARY
jgi:hypothetical protein